MDSELAAIVATLPSLEPGTPAEARERARAFTEANHIPVPGRAALHIDERLAPGPPGAPDVPVRIYRPATDGERRAAVVYFHGGGFIAGDLDSEDVRCVRYAADADCIVVSVDYRLAPEHRFPAPAEDCYAATAWVASAADELGIDHERIGVGGGSAGGTLAAAVALMARDRSGPQLSFQLLLYPALDDRLQTASVRRLGTPIIDAAACVSTWNHYLGADRDAVSPYAAPARAEDLADLPPTYLMVSELDPLRDECLAFATALARADVAVELHLFAGAFHGFDLMPAALSKRAVDEQVQWLREVTRLTAGAS